MEGQRQHPAGEIAGLVVGFVFSQMDDCRPSQVAGILIAFGVNHADGARELASGDFERLPLDLDLLCDQRGIHETCEKQNMEDSLHDGSGS